MEHKKGQITIFIIIGIVLLVAVGFLFYYQTQIVERGDIQRIFSFGLDVTPIEQYVQSCLKTVSLDAIENISEQGGYYNLDNVLSTDSSLYSTAYYFYEDRVLIPNKKKVEEEIENYINEHILFCISDFDAFREQGFNISFGYTENSVTLNPNEVIISMNMPVEITKQDQKKELKRFYVNLNDVRLGSMLETASTLINNQLLDPDYIPLSYIYDVAERDNFFIHIEDERDINVYFFIIIDNRSNPSRKLIYANKYREYSCDDLPIDADTSDIIACMERRIAESGYVFYLKDIPDMNATIENEFYYKVNASGLNLNFSDSTHLFDINVSTGVINFTPTIDQLGNHLVWINVMDDLGKEDFESFYLNITNSTI